MGARRGAFPPLRGGPRHWTGSGATDPQVGWGLARKPGGAFVGSGCCQHPLWPSCQAYPRGPPAGTQCLAAPRAQCPVVGCPQLITVSDGGHTSQQLQPRRVAVSASGCLTGNPRGPEAAGCGLCGRRWTPPGLQAAGLACTSLPTLLLRGPGVSPGSLGNREPGGAASFWMRWQRPGPGKCRAGCIKLLCLCPWLATFPGKIKWRSSYWSAKPNLVSKEKLSRCHIHS